MIDCETRNERAPQDRSEALAGLRDGRWEVRRACVLWLRRHGDAEARAALRPMLRDPKRKVRAAALYAVGCRHEDGVDAEAIPLLVERVLDDESVRIRRFALALLAYEHAHPQLEGFFQRLLDTETDAKLHRSAGIGLWRAREAARNES